jgi:hypothetical protein
MTEFKLVNSTPPTFAHNTLGVFKTLSHIPPTKLEKYIRGLIESYSNGKLTALT